MGKLLRVLALLPALFLASCGGGDSDGGGGIGVQAAIRDANHEYLLGFGETIRVERLGLEFTSVAEDSRCPDNALVQCVWEGNARIIVTATRSGTSGVFELNSNARFATSATFEGYTITLVRLDPYPGLDPIPVHTYVASLTVRRATS